MDRVLLFRREVPIVEMRDRLWGWSNYLASKTGGYAEYINISRTDYLTFPTYKMFMFYQVRKPEPLLYVWGFYIGMDTGIIYLNTKEDQEMIPFEDIARVFEAVFIVALGYLRQSDKTLKDMSVEFYGSVAGIIGALQRYKLLGDTTQLFTEASTPQKNGQAFTSSLIKHMLDQQVTLLEEGNTKNPFDSLDNTQRALYVECLERALFEVLSEMFQARKAFGEANNVISKEYEVDQYNGAYDTDAYSSNDPSVVPGLGSFNSLTQATKNPSSKGHSYLDRWYSGAGISQTNKWKAFGADKGVEPPFTGKTMVQTRLFQTAAKAYIDSVEPGFLKEEDYRVSNLYDVVDSMKEGNEIIYSSDPKATMERYGINKIMNGREFRGLYTRIKGVRKYISNSNATLKSINRGFNSDFTSREEVDHLLYDHLIYYNKVMNYLGGVQ